MNSNLPEWEQLLNALFEGTVIACVFFGLQHLERWWKTRRKGNT